MTMLIDGQWRDKWQPVHKQDAAGRFIRPTSTVRNWITPDGTPGPTGRGGFPTEAGRYHLYVALICPWACRTLAVRSLLGLQEAISVSVVNPVLTEQGWAFADFPGATEDHLFGFRYLHQVYSRNDPQFTGSVTVPVLWDKQQNVMVNNESADILRIFGTSFGSLMTDSAPELYPAQHAAEIEALNKRSYEMLNNGVYRAGFAQSQQAYDEAYRDVFSMLDALEERLGGKDYLISEQVCETDIRIFVTLVRFDAAYHGLFKCNRQRICDYPNLWDYLKRIYALPGVADTVNLKHIKHGYYNLKNLNPLGIVPQGPDLDFS
jgi:putative glutathione S-transferase